MKSRILASCNLALVLAIFSGCIQRASKTDAEAVISPETQKASEITLTEDVEPNDPSDAAFRRLDTEQSIPAGLNLSRAVSDILKLATAGVKEDVLLAYVDRSDSTFTLGADEIIYLNDLGVPPMVVAAMIKRDAVLRNAMVAAGESAATPEIPETSAKALSSQRSSQLDSSAVSELPDSDSAFRDALSPYGRWVEIDGYGECWLPAVAATEPNWQPYFDAGHWVYVDAGWYWLSDYSWGWAPFHYGRWFHHRYLGWCWEPDAVWGPAWVSWRYNDEYCGWAPLPPSAKYSRRSGLVVNGRSVGADHTFGLTADHYAFIPFAHFRDHQLRPHRLPLPEIAALFNHTTPITRITGPGNSVINHGIPPTRIAFLTGAPVERIPLANLHPSQPLAGQPGIANQPRPSVHPMPQPPTRPDTGALAATRQETYPPNSLILIGSQSHTAPQPSRPTGEFSSRRFEPLLFAETESRSPELSENQTDVRDFQTPASFGPGNANQWPSGTLPTAYYNPSIPPATPHPIHASPETLNRPHPSSSTVGPSSTHASVSASHSPAPDRYENSTAQNSPSAAPSHQPPPESHILSPTEPSHQPPPEVHSRPEPPPSPVQSHNQPHVEPPPPPHPAQPESHPPPPTPPAPPPAPASQPASSSSSHSSSESRPR
jgi:hypothetical protein